MRRRGEIKSMAEGFAQLQADYAAAKTSRFRRQRSGVSASGKSADYHYRSETEYLRMLELARDMDRNDTIVGQTIDRAVTNTVQDGFSLDPSTGDGKLDTEIVARWKEWAEEPDACDLAGEMAFADMEHAALRAALADGDMIALPNRDAGALELVEAHRLRTPSNTRKNVIHGVLLDGNRKRQEYWLTRNDIDPRQSLTRVSDCKAYPARDDEGHRQVFHVYNPKRTSQTRGVTAMAPIVDLCGMIEDINFAKLVQQQVVSCFAIFRERGPDWQGGASPQTGARSEETLSDGSTRTLQGIAPGMQIDGQPDEKLHGFSPNVPNPEYFVHVRMILQLIGVNLGLPLVMVLLDSKETNFSGWRGAIDQARMGFRHNQRWLARRFHRPVYFWKLRQWAAEDQALRVRLESGILNRPQWNPPTWAYIEPLKDSQADLLRVRNALTSHRRQKNERGQDWDVISTEIVEDNALLIRRAAKKAEELNKEFSGLGITWREIACLPTPDGVQVALNDSPSQSDGGNEA